MLRRLLAVVAILVGLWAIAVAVLFVWSPFAGPAPPHADAVVVLSGGLNRRLDPALAIERRGVAPVLAISGAYEGYWPKAQKLCTGQTPTRYRVICFQPHPYSTRGEARAIAKLAAQHGWTHIVVVTSPYHVTRARMLFARCFKGDISMVSGTAPFSKLPLEWALESGKLFVQYFFESGC